MCGCARAVGPGHVIVTVLNDSGLRYASKLYNPEFLRSKNLPIPPWMNEQQQQFQEHLNGMLKAAFVPVPQ